jgi:hypothetical protein
MPSTLNRNPARRVGEASSLLGLVEFRPRLTIVLIFLTLTVAVVGWRIARDAGGHRVDALAREAMERYAEAPAKDGTVGLTVEQAETRIRALSGVLLELPRNEEGFVVDGVLPERFHHHAGAVLRFRYEGDRFLLLISRGDRIFGNETSAAFPAASFLSGERGGKSFVFWEREGTSFIMVSAVDVTRNFDLVRRFFT